jgi:phage shock protein PspC (stress-responsive transcriptional regulator)
VCGGLAESFDLDADAVRAAWILLGLWGGIGLAPYVAALLLLPEQEFSPDSRPPDRRRRNLGLALIALAGVSLYLALGVPVLPWPGLLFGAAWRILFPIVLLGAGALLVWPALRDRVGFTRERRFRRSSSQRILAGVCGGLGVRTGLDPNLLRVIAVTLSFLSAGTVVLLYVVLVVVVPEELDAPGESPPAPAVPESSQAPPEVDR